jgi:hypothetical protein
MRAMGRREATGRAATMGIVAAAIVAGAILAGAIAPAGALGVCSSAAGARN